MQTVFPMTALSCGQSGVIQSVQLHGAMYERLCDLGFLPGTVVTSLFSSIFGDPRAYCIRGTVIALRRSDAEQISCICCGGEP